MMGIFNFSPLNHTASKTAIIDRVNLLMDKMKALGDIKVTGARTRRGPDGMNINIKAIRATSSDIAYFRVQEQKDDYLECKTWDGTTLGNEIINVAKPFGLMRTIYEAMIGLTYYYTYNNVYSRVLKRTSDNEAFTTEYIVPWYNAVEGSYNGDIILAIAVSDLWITDDLSNQINWMDLNVDGRCWCS